MLGWPSRLVESRYLLAPLSNGPRDIVESGLAVIGEGELNVRAASLVAVKALLRVADVLAK